MNGIPNTGSDATHMPANSHSSGDHAGSKKANLLGNSCNYNNATESGGTGGSQYCVLWNNYHSSLVSAFGGLRKEGQLIDCTLACTDGGRVHAHQLILAACSSICRDFFKDIGSKHPVILLPSEIAVTELRSMVEFMYTGQACIEQERLKAFVHGARYLRIRGLEDNADDTDAEDADSCNGSHYYKSHLLKNENKQKIHINSAGGEGEDEEDGDGGDKDNWQVVERKPIILPQARAASPGGSRKRRRLTTSRRRPMHLSNSIVCYEQSSSGAGGAQRSHTHYHHHSGGGGSFKHDSRGDDSTEPINKIRRMSTQQGHYHDDMEICTCSSRKTWSVADTEALLKVWGETLTQVPPSYFIRSMSLCKRVARNLQARGVHKNWRQCQVKMKNLRREVRLFKESQVRCRLISRKPSEVANACEKLLPNIEEIFNKEEEIRQEWYQLKTDDRHREDGGEDVGVSSPRQRDILAQVAVLADSDLGDEDTDGAGCLDEGVDDGESGVRRGTGREDIVAMEVASEASEFVTRRHDTPHHSVHPQPDGSIHHIVEDVSLHMGDAGQ